MFLVEFECVRNTAPHGVCKRLSSTASRQMVAGKDAIVSSKAERCQKYVSQQNAAAPRFPCQLAKHGRVVRPRFCQYRAGEQSLGTWRGRRGAGAPGRSGARTAGHGRSQDRAWDPFPSTSPFPCETWRLFTELRETCRPPREHCEGSGRIVLLFSSRKQEGECYLVKPECPRGFRGVSVPSKQVSEHTVARLGARRGDGLARGSGSGLIWGQGCGVGGDGWRNVGTLLSTCCGPDATLTSSDQTLSLGRWRDAHRLFCVQGTFKSDLLPSGSSAVREPGWGRGEWGSCSRSGPTLTRRLSVRTA